MRGCEAAPETPDDTAKASSGARDHGRELYAAVTSFEHSWVPRLQIL